MSFEEFNTFIKDFGLNDHIFTPRESTLAFVWSRMRVIDDGRSKRGRPPTSVQPLPRVTIHTRPLC